MGNEKSALSKHRPQAIGGSLVENILNSGELGTVLDFVTLERSWN
jgi:hypothetical protein